MRPLINLYTLSTCTLQCRLPGEGPEGGAAFGCSVVTKCQRELATGVLARLSPSADGQGVQNLMFWPCTDER